MNEPIIQSLLDVDLYKFTMLQWIMRYFPTARTVFEFKNRTGRIKLGNEIDLGRLREEIAAVKACAFTDDEIAYVASLPFIRDTFADELRTLALADVFVDRTSAGELIVQTEGLWRDTTLWETIILSLVNELYVRSRTDSMHQTQRSDLYHRGTMRLREKIRMLKLFPEIRFSEFGTRRRFGREWQRAVVEILAESMPESFVGTSNVLLAKEFGLRPVGTLAHELFMGLYGIRRADGDDGRDSHNEVLRLWRDLYGNELSTALTDTYGTDFFFRDISDEQAHQWQGLRQDSGDPFVFGEKAIAFYERRGINPREKTIVFSDGLDAETIVRLHVRFNGRIRTFFGWGTNLTNDMEFPPLSIVMKLVSANGKGTVKLSDNIAKAIGDPDDIVDAVRLFDYVEVFNESPLY